MGRRLEQMSLQELWELFPIEIVAYRPEWPEWAHQEMSFLSELLADCSPVIHHIGSTAVPGLAAKPIVDILVGLPGFADREWVRKTMEDAGYICMALSPRTMSFNKGYTPDGYARKVFHIHFRLLGDNDELYFRDYLRAHPDIAREYAILKLSLLPRFRHDRDGYTSAKSGFINRITRIAVSEANRQDHLPE
ncbi:MAG: GrpB family protein [Bacteroidales bacterium]|nr:GrpB family protein [Bacteroidales bacterium]